MDESCHRGVIGVSIARVNFWSNTNLASPLGEAWYKRSWFTGNIKYKLALLSQLVFPGTKKMTHWPSQSWLNGKIEQYKLALSSCYRYRHPDYASLTWLIHMWHASHVTWLTHWYVTFFKMWQDWFIRDMTHSYVWHDSFICVTWLIHMYDMTHSYVTFLLL